MKKVYYHNDFDGLVNDLIIIFKNKYEFIFLKKENAIDVYLDKNDIYGIQSIIDISYTNIAPYEVINNANCVLAYYKELYLHSKECVFVDYFVKSNIEIYCCFKGFLPRLIDDVLKKYELELGPVSYRYFNTLDNENYIDLQHKANCIALYVESKSNMEKNKDQFTNEDISIVEARNKQWELEFKEIKNGNIELADYNYWKGIRDLFNLISYGSNEAGLLEKKQFDTKKM